jgi:hypothetical protein
VKRKAKGLVAPLELKNNDLTAKIAFKREELQARRDERYDIHERLVCIHTHKHLSFITIIVYMNIQVCICIYMWEHVISYEYLFHSNIVYLIACLLFFRLKISETFYMTEGICCANLIEKIDFVLSVLNVQRNNIILKILNFQKELENVNDVIKCVSSDTMIVSRYDMLNLIMYIDKQKLLRLSLSSIGSRVINNGEEWVTGVLGLGYLVSGVELRILELLVEAVERERGVLMDYEEQRSTFALHATLWQYDSLNLRKQKVVQGDMDVRKKRLQIQRTEKMKRLKDEKGFREQQEKDFQAAEKLRREDLSRERTFTETTASWFKKNIRAMKDEIRNYRNNVKDTLSEEEQRIANAIRARSKHSLVGRIEGIKAIHITASAKETDLFERQNIMLSNKGFLYFEKLKLLVPLSGELCLWIQTCFNPVEFITSIIISHIKAGQL